MPLNLIFISAGNYTLDDDGIPGNNTSVIRDGTGAVIYTFAHPADSLGFTATTSGVNLTVNFLDSLGAADFSIGDLLSPANSPDSIVVRRVNTTGDATLVANGAITEGGTDAAADIVAGSLILSAGQRVGTSGNALEIQTSTLEAETTTGGLNLVNFGTVMIGGLSDEVNGLRVETSGSISLLNYGSIFLSDATGAESVRGGSSSSNVTLTANGSDADIIASVNKDAINASGGKIVLEAGRDIGFGIVGADFDNDVRAAGSVTINAGRDFLIDGFSDLASDDFGQATGGGVTINAGRNIHMRNIAGTDASILASGSAGADVVLTTGFGGALILDAPTSTAVAASSGDVIVNADRALIEAASGIMASNGQVTLRPVTDGREVILGSTSNAALMLELSDAELDRIFTPTLTVGGANAGNVTIAANISPANASNLVIRSGADITFNAGVSATVTGELRLHAADNIILLAGASVAAPGGFTGFVDVGNTDPGIGGTAFVDANFASAVRFFGNADGDSLSGGLGNDTLDGAGGNDTINGGGGIDTINGGDGNDTLRGGGDGTEEIVHGDGGDDTIHSTGEGQYFGDAGDDLIIAGSSSGVVDEVLDGGAGVDTLDTRSFNGAYEINLATGVTNFNYESFVNFENVMTGSGNDVIVGTIGDNMLNGGGGADQMRGGGGNDTYVVDDAGDTVVETTNRGTDLVLSSISFSLGGKQVENLTLTGIADTNATGNSFDNVITGNAGSNVLNGSSGADQMAGGAGNDTYVVDNVGDVVDEVINSGIDLVRSSISFSLGGKQIENLTLTGTADTNGTGNTFANVLTGNSGDNVLNGGSGSDELSGGAGADTFAFSTALGASNIDSILSFSVVDDTIRLSSSIFNSIVGLGTLSAAQFVANASGSAQDANDRIVYDTDSGQLFFDSNGNGAGGVTQFAILDPGLALTNADFLVV